MKMKKTKSLSNIEYELDEIFNFEDNFKNVNNIHLPEQIIASFKSFGINTDICIGYGEHSNLFYITAIEDEHDVKLAKVIDIRDIDDDKIIIRCECQKQDKEKKIRFVDSIVKEIDFRQGLCNEVFVKMLCNVFTEQRLKEIFECDDVEILSFNGLMYLKIMDRAYRL